jgi:exonuclease VII large subunit
MPLSVLRRAGSVLARSGVQLADGLEVRVFGALEIGGRYAPLRLVVSALDQRTSVGSVVVARSELLAALEEDGSIRRNRATPLAPAPLRIGLVVPTSGGAGHGDFVGRLRSSGHPWQLRELRVAMEGPSAPADMSASRAATQRESVSFGANGAAMASSRRLRARSRSPSSALTRCC